MNNESSGNHRRRHLAISVIAALVLTIFVPGLAGAQQKAKNQKRPKSRRSVQAFFYHIPPIDMQGGSFTIFTEGPMGTATPNDGSSTNRRHKHLFANGIIEEIRILNTDGTFLFNRSDAAISGAQIQIWLENLLEENLLENEADLLVRKDFSSNFLAIETKRPLTEDTSGVHSRRTRIYPFSPVRIKRVRIILMSGAIYTFDTTEHQEVYHVLIWARR